MNELTEKSKRKARPVNWKRRLLIGAVIGVLLMLGALYYMSTMLICGCQPPPEYWETVTVFELTNDQKRVHLTQTASAATSDPAHMGLNRQVTPNVAVPATATAVPGS